MKRLIILFVALFLFSRIAIAIDIPKTKPGLSFKENKGQVGDQFSKPRPDVLFTGNSGNLTFHLGNNGISYQMYRVDSWKEIENEGPVKNGAAKKVPAQQTVYRLDINWLNVNANVNLVKENAIEGYDNYYSEVCPNGVTGVKSYKNVTYKNLYNGVDLKWYEKDGELKYDYILAAGADFHQIKLEVKGSESISLGKNGALFIKTPLGTIEEKAPYVTQNGKILKAKWTITSNVLSFNISNVDPTKQLVIDPLVRLWGTYYGNSGDDGLLSCEADATGNIYASGFSTSQNNIATVGTHQTTFSGGTLDDAILVKFSSSGTRLWGTYYGGTGEDYAQQCAIDASGNNVALVGCTSTTLNGAIATPGTHQTSYGGSSGGLTGDVFLAVFNSAGVRQWGTYYGGASNEWGYGCDYDNNGDIFITGLTSSSVGIASAGAHQTIFMGLRDGFIAKFNNTGALLWGTYYGGTQWEWLASCKTDPSGNIFVVGTTNSKTNISTSGVIQPSLAALYGRDDAVIAKFNSMGTLQWGTYYGGIGDDSGYNCVVDAGGNIYMAGVTTPMSQTTVPTPNAYQPNYGGGSYDAFLLKLSPNGSSMSWCTYYGGKRNEINSWCSIDPTGNIYLVGCTSSTNGIASTCAYQQNFGGLGSPPSQTMSMTWAAEGGDAYIAKFEPNGSRLWGTYYGGAGFEGGWGYDINCSSSVDDAGNLLLVGMTGAPSSPVMTSAGAHQEIYGGGSMDGYLIKFDGCIPNALNTTDPSSLSVCYNNSTILTASAACTVAWYDVPFGGAILDSTFSHQTASLTANTTFYVSDLSCGTTTIRTPITVTVNALPIISIELDPSVLCYKTSVNAKASGAVSYTWFPDQWISCTNCADPVLTPLETSTFCVEGIDGNFCTGKTCTAIVVFASGGHNFSLPNAFTPNGDKTNDMFCLQGWDMCSAEFKIAIYDRWGEKVFESTDPNFCWDGIFKGQLLSSDVYVYSVNAKYKDNTEVNKKGNITLIR